MRTLTVTEMDVVAGGANSLLESLAQCTYDTLIGGAAGAAVGAALAGSRSPIWPFRPDSSIDNGTGTSIMNVMLDCTKPDLLVLARLYLQNKRLFVVRRCLQRFAAGEMTAREAVLRIRQHPDVCDDERFFNDPPAC